MRSTTVGIQTRPQPFCPICGAKMKLRRPKTRQNWEAFWGCQSFPECDGSRSIREDGKPEEN